MVQALAPTSVTLPGLVAQLGRCTYGLRHPLHSNASEIPLLFAFTRRFYLHSLKEVRLVV
jgi:hypothetical protein